MNKVIKLKQDKLTKRTVRYVESKDQYPLQIYLMQAELGLPYPEEIWVKISTEEIKA